MTPFRIVGGCSSSISACEERAVADGRCQRKKGRCHRDKPSITDACRLVTCVGGCSRTPTRTSSLLFIRKDGRGMTPTACAHVSNFPANFRHSTFARRPHNIKNFSISTKPSPFLLLLLSSDSPAE